MKFGRPLPCAAGQDRGRHGRWPDLRERLRLRAVTSVDGMTADVYPFEPAFRGWVATRIVNEVRGINRVVYDSQPSHPAPSSGNKAVAHAGCWCGNGPDHREMIGNCYQVTAVQGFQRVSFEDVAGIDNAVGADLFRQPQHLGIEPLISENQDGLDLLDLTMRVLLPNTSDQSEKGGKGPDLDQLQKIAPFVDRHTLGVIQTFKDRLIFTLDDGNLVSILF